MKKILAFLVVFSIPAFTMASEADLVIPSGMKHETILYWTFLVTIAGFLFGLYQYKRVKKIGVLSLSVLSLPSILVSFRVDISES